MRIDWHVRRRVVVVLTVVVVGGARGPHHAPPLVEQGLEPPARAPHTRRYPRRAVIHLGAGGERAGRSALPSPILDRDTDSLLDALIEYDRRGAVAVAT